MEALSELSIAITLFLQSLGSWLVTPMKLISFLGVKEFYLFIAPAIFWCFDTSLGLRVGLYFLSSASLNGILKLAFHTPRPYWIDGRIQALSTETSFGIPSGHAQNAVAVWGGLADGLKRSWAWPVALVIIFLIGLSRLHLGVHFLIDVLAGLLFGSIFLWLLIRYEKRMLAWLFTYSITTQIIIILGATLATILVGALVRLGLKDWQLPVSWVQSAAAATPEADAIAPLSLSGLITSASAFFGLALGGLLTRRTGMFDAGGKAWKRLARFLVGLVGVFLIWYGLGEIFPGGENLLSYGLRFLRYSLVGLWIAFLAPLIFLRAGLAERCSP